MAQSSLPARPPDQPGLPENAEITEFSGWEGINLKPPRAGVERNKAYWSLNMQPLGANNMAAIPDCSQTPFYTAPSGLTIIHYDFFGIQPNFDDTGPYLIAFLSDGSAVQKSINFGTVTQIAPPGTFSPPANTLPAVRQFGIQYLLIVTEQSLNAYWIWDGNVLYGPGTLSPEINLTDTGTGYTSVPSVTTYGGSGTGATFTAQIFNGGVSMVTVTNPGSGYASSDAPEALLLFTGGGAGNSAYGVAGIANGAITNINIQSGGSGFTGVPSLIISDISGTGAVAVVTGISGGVITSVSVLDAGHGYVSPSITTSGGGGSGFIATLTVTDGVIESYSLLSSGTGYIGAPEVFFIAPTGSGATAIANMNGGTIASLSFGDGTQNFTGSGYSGSVVIGFKGGGGPASGTIQLMPFGIHGYTMEVYNSQVWIYTILVGVKKFWSAPGSVADFGAPDGGGAAPATDSNLRYQYTAALQSNGFLYEIGDSLTSYISGVQTTGSPATTTFSDLNIDPQIGSPWRDSCEVYSRAIMIVNDFGAHAIYGGAVQKISTELDPLFPSSIGDSRGSFAGDYSNVLGGPSSAVATVFGVHCFCLLLPIIDPISGTSENIILMWDGKRWWPALQSVPMTKIRTQEWGSDINAYGLDQTQTTIRQLFTTPSTLTTKLLVSRLGREPHIIAEKKGWMLYAMWQGNATLSFTWDNESGSTPITQGPFAPGSTTPNWARSKSPDTLGFTVGFTMSATAASFTVIDVTQMWQLRRMKT